MKRKNLDRIERAFKSKHKCIKLVALAYDDSTLYEYEVNSYDRAKEVIDIMAADCQVCFVGVDLYKICHDRKDNCKLYVFKKRLMTGEKTRTINEVFCSCLKSYYSDDTEK